MAEDTLDIRDFRVVAIWTATFLDLLADARPATVPMAFLGRDGSYIRAFESVKTGGALPTGLQAPWPHPLGQLFWKQYLEGNWPRDVQGKTAWRSLVPFHGRVPATLSADWWKGPLALHAFHYPHGVAVVLEAKHVRLKSAARGVTLKEAVERSLDLHHRADLTVQWEGEAETRQPLDAVADEALRRLATAAAGRTPRADRPLRDPFTVFAVVSAGSADPADPVVDGDQVHSALEAVTSWNDQWKAVRPAPLAQGALDIKASPPNHVLYARKRGRAIWFPHLFSLTGPTRKLSCYQRNLALASLQVDSLLGLTAITDKAFSAGESLATAHWDLAKSACDVLGRLYGGAPSIYRSASVRAQIEASGLVPVVNNVRGNFGKAPLS